jgi:hypothetical protein
VAEVAAVISSPVSLAILAVFPGHKHVLVTAKLTEVFVFPSVIPGELMHIKLKQFTTASFQIVPSSSVDY